MMNYTIDDVLELYKSGALRQHEILRKIWIGYFCEEYKLEKYFRDMLLKPLETLSTLFGDKKIVLEQKKVKTTHIYTIRILIDRVRLLKIILTNKSMETNLLVSGFVEEINTYNYYNLSELIKDLEKYVGEKGEENQMKDWQIAKEKVEDLLKKNYSGNSWVLAEKFFEDNFGMGEMYMDIVDSRGSGYVINTQDMTIQSVEEFVDEILENAKDCDDLQEWLVEINESGYLDELERC